jgi:LemA protein
MSMVKPAPGQSKTWLMVLSIVLLVAVIVIAMVATWYVRVGNRLVNLDENVKKQWSQVETVLQRRFDLIPNLVNTVKGYATHEKETLTRITELRSQWGAAKTVEQKAAAASELEGLLSRLLVVAENYPELKADKGFRDLQVQLEGTENRIAVERQRYNESLNAYNTAVRQVPGSLVARMRGMKTNDAYFKSSFGAEAAPKVDFSDDKKEST